MNRGSDNTINRTTYLHSHNRKEFLHKSYIKLNKKLLGTLVVSLLSFVTLTLGINSIYEQNLSLTLGLLLAEGTKLGLKLLCPGAHRTPLYALCCVL